MFKNPQEIFHKRDEFGIENSINMLFEIIEKDKDVKKRKNAIKYLGLITHNSTILKEECFEVLENILISDDNIDLKCEAANSLSFLGIDKVLKPLKWILEQESTDNQVSIAALKTIANVRFSEPEINLFIKELDSKYQSIKECVVHQLIKLKPEKLIKFLLESLKKDSYSEKHKIEAIKLIGHQLSTVNLFPKDSKSYKITYPEILSELIQYKKMLLEVIITFLKDDFLNSALIILKAIGREINNELIDFVHSEDFIIKTNAIKLIGELQIKDGRDALLENLDNIYDEVSKASIKSLGEIGDLSTVPKLLNILNIEDLHFEYIDLDMKWYILDAIKKIYLMNKDADFDYLYSIINTKNEILLESVAYLFGELGYDLFINPLIELLNKRNLDVRKNAAIALGKIGNKDAMDPLISIIEDKNNYWLLKKVASDALYNIYLINLSIESKRSESERFFVMRSERLIDHLKNNLDENPKVKLSLIKILEDFGGKTAINALLKQVNDFHRIVRISSTKAIKKIEKRLGEEEPD
ncbi:MAG: HEAT repeat domain-containing protein [Candidatus Hodarchaeota archaeon]